MCFYVQWLSLFLASSTSDVFSKAAPGDYDVLTFPNHITFSINIYESICR